MIYHCLMTSQPSLAKKANIWIVLSYWIIRCSFNRWTKRTIQRVYAIINKTNGRWNRRVRFILKCSVSSHGITCGTKIMMMLHSSFIVFFLLCLRTDWFSGCWVQRIEKSTSYITIISPNIIRSNCNCYKTRAVYTCNFLWLLSFPFVLQYYYNNFFLKSNIYNML